MKAAQNVDAPPPTARKQTSRPIITREYHFEPLIDEKVIHINTLEYFTGEDNCNARCWLKKLSGIESLKIRRDPTNKLCRVILFLKLRGSERDRIRISSLIDEFNNLMNATVA